MILITGNPALHQERRLQAPDGTEMFVRHWPAAEPRAALVYLHGQGDHTGPFSAMGDLLSARGYAIYALDQRGFGQSPAPRGDIASYDLLVADCRHLIRHVHVQHPGLPVFLIGLSMGGHIALRSAAGLGPADLAGIVALSPGLGLRHTPWPILLRTLWHYCFHPRQYLPTFIVDSVQTTRNQQHYERAGQDPSWVQAYTARFYVAAARSVRQARREMAQLMVPVLILQGAEDHLVDPVRSQQYFVEIASRDKEYRLLPGLYHNLVVEPEMPELVGVLDHWMRRRISHALNRNHLQ